MRKYEMMLIFDIDIPLEESKKFMYDTFQSNKVEILEEKDFGLKDLAYAINKKNKGHYYLLYLQADENILDKINKDFKLYKGIIRQLTIKQEK